MNKTIDKLVGLIAYLLMAAVIMWSVFIATDENNPYYDPCHPKGCDYTGYSQEANP